MKSKADLYYEQQQLLRGKVERVFLTRRNLNTLLSKLDRVKAGEESACSITKNDNVHPKYPQSVDHIMVTAIEDEDYYIDREPGKVFEKDIK